MLLLTWDQFTIDSQTERDGSRRIAFLRLADGFLLGSLFIFWKLQKRPPSQQLHFCSRYYSVKTCRPFGSYSPPPSPPLHSLRNVHKMELQRGGTESAASLRDEGQQEVRWSGPVRWSWIEALHSNTRGCGWSFPYDHQGAKHGGPGVPVTQ